MKYGVITKVCEPTTGGNMATAFELFEADDVTDTYRAVHPMISLALRVPVFHVGELLILDNTGRELVYPRRKPSKWDVTCEEFDDLEEAVARALEVGDG